MAATRSEDPDDIVIARRPGWRRAAAIVFLALFALLIVFTVVKGA